jgi:hypothetical protein
VLVAAVELYFNSSFSVGGAAVATEVYAVCAKRTERQDVYMARVLGAAVEGSYEKETTKLEEDEETEREDERGVAKRPDTPRRARCTEWAELVATSTG